MLVEKLTENDLALIEVIEDPIWFGEFMRETNDGSSEKEQHRPFKYRWYQRDILTDRSKRIVVVGGRSVGKCSPGFERVYTDKGYETLENLYNKTPFFNVYTWTGSKYVIRRAFVDVNGVEQVYRVTTKSGKSFHGTKNHPMLTQDGYVEIEKLRIGDRVAVIKRLPEPAVPVDVFDWYDLRAIGYIFGRNAIFSPNGYFKLRYKRQYKEMELLAQRYRLAMRTREDGAVFFVAPLRTGRNHPFSVLMAEAFERRLEDVTSLKNNRKYALFINYLPKRLLDHSNAALKTFLEAFISIAGVFNPPEMGFLHQSDVFIKDVINLLKRFGIDAVLRGKRTPSKYYCEFLNPSDVVSTFDIPGIRNTPSEREVDPFVFEEIANIEPIGEMMTYAVQVAETKSYISGDFYVHNSVVLEDMLLYSIVNGDIALPETPEMLFVTANVAQMTPVLDRVISRLTNGEFFRSLAVDPNRSKGTVDVKTDRTYRLFARIAGKTGESNLVGLHVSKIFVDEAQILPKSAYQQMLPTLNTWQKNHQLIMFGVPNGLTRGNVLWEADQLVKSFKKYRIPAHENPFFSKKDNDDALAQFGGKTGDDYLNLVLGKHGTPTSKPLPRESIVREPFEFFSYRYSIQDQNNGYAYSTLIKTPKLEQKYCSNGLVFTIDSGFVQSTVIHVLGCDEKLIWRSLLRVTLTRIHFPDQAEIVHHLAQAYKPSRIIFDYGAGGGGLATAQILEQNYGMKEVGGVFFNRAVQVGTDTSGRPINQAFKEYAAGILVRMILSGELRFSELDIEGVMQLERLATQRRQDGTYRYFVMAENSRGEDGNDHIFASYLVFAGSVALESMTSKTETRSLSSLVSAKWI